MNNGTSRELQAAVEVARLARDAGGRALLVGGCVRDGLLGASVKDVDIEVFGLSPDVLKNELSRRFELDLLA